MKDNYAMDSKIRKDSPKKKKDLFYWHFDEKKQEWVFGDYWITDFLGGFACLLGFICIISVPFGIALIMLAVGFILGRVTI